MRDSNNQQDPVEGPPMDHSNFVVPICGEDTAGAAWHASTTRHAFGARLDDDKQLSSMPRLSKWYPDDSSVDDSSADCSSADCSSGGRFIGGLFIGGRFIIRTIHRWTIHRGFIIENQL